ncbi:DUF2809 domain-containing protein [Glutamicibacter sp. NPDC087344]|uniref:ribosomal maturation YjgA family protein n=1 Tax=Glutamicibacter sp. NPDC087344 TaxID=3363994 RepID=UPI0038177492
MSTRRLTLGIIAVAMVPLGLSARYLSHGLAADLSGGLLYAVLIYILFAILSPKRSPLIPAALAGLWCFGIEFLQLTNLPAQISTAFPAAHLIFGSSFAALDLLAYTAGILMALWIDRLLLKRAGTPAKHSP